MEFVVVAKWTARDGEADRVSEYVRELAPLSRKEPGSRLYAAHRDPEDTNVFLFYERYEDEAAYRAHLDSAHFRRFGLDGAIPLLAGREREFYEVLDI